MDFEAMAARVASSPRRRSVLTTRPNMDSDAAGAPRVRDAEDLVDHLEKAASNAVLLEAGGGGWVAVYRDLSGSGYAVARVPTKQPGNLLSKKVKDAASAVDAAMMV